MYQLPSQMLVSVQDTVAWLLATEGPSPSLAGAEERSLLSASCGMRRPGAFLQRPCPIHLSSGTYRSIFSSWLQPLVTEAGSQPTLSAQPGPVPESCGLLAPGQHPQGCAHRYRWEELGSHSVTQTGLRPLHPGLDRMLSPELGNNGTLNI